MARVTVEDCVTKVPNRFELVMKAAQRARDISAGAALTLERDDDKNPVVALREIAEETVNLDELGTALVQGLQKHVEADEPEDDQIDFNMPGVGIEAAMAMEQPSLADTDEDGQDGDDESQPLADDGETQVG